MSKRHNFICKVCGNSLRGHQRCYCSRECYYIANKAGKRIREKDHRKRVLDFLGNKCVRCGISDVRVLQVDHVNGNGYRERVDNNWSGKTVHGYYRHILDVKGEGYQLLCANCNWIKRDEQHEHN